MYKTINNIINNGHLTSSEKLDGVINSLHSKDKKLYIIGRKAEFPGDEPLDLIEYITDDYNDAHFILKQIRKDNFDENGDVFNIYDYYI